MTDIYFVAILIWPAARAGRGKNKRTPKCTIDGGVDTKKTREADTRKHECIGSLSVCFSLWVCTFFRTINSIFVLLRYVPGNYETIWNPSVETYVGNSDICQALLLFNICFVTSQTIRSVKKSNKSQNWLSSTTMYRCLFQGSSTRSRNVNELRALRDLLQFKTNIKSSFKMMISSEPIFFVAPESKYSESYFGHFEYSGTLRLYEVSKPRILDAAGIFGRR